MAYTGLGANNSVLVSTGTSNAFTVNPTMAGTFTSTGLTNNGFSVVHITTTSTTPYVAAANDFIIAVNASGGAKTVQLPNAPTTGRLFHIKDSTGSAGTNNITLTTVGGIVTIDGATSYGMTSNYQSVCLVFNGTSYIVL